MMEEIARLQGTLGQDAKTVGQLSPIVAAAQQMLLIRAEGGDTKDALINLEQQFLPAHKRAANIAAEEAAKTGEGDDDNDDA